MTHPTPDDGQQPRIPGVKYREVTRTRWETTTINGIPEGREVEYTVAEPVPPRDWDAVVALGVVSFTAVTTLLAASATTASVGGLLDKTLPAAVAYSGGVLFTGAWLICLAVEWLERRDPKRAMPARVAGWVALLIAMAAVIAYGTDRSEPLAGGAGACLDLLAKGCCALVIRYHATKLSEPVAFWMRRRREKIAAEAAVAAELQRLDRFAAYNRAVYGPTAVTAAAITTTVTAPPRPLPATDISAPVSAPVSAQAPVVPAPVSAPAAVPAVMVEQQPSPAAAPAPTPQPTSEPEATPVAPKPEPVAPPLRTVGDQPGIAATMRAVLEKTPAISDADLVTEVRAVVGDRPNLTDTVVRTRRRLEKKKAAS